MGYLGWLSGLRAEESGFFLVLGQRSLWDMFHARPINLTVDSNIQFRYGSKKQFKKKTFCFFEFAHHKQCLVIERHPLIKTLCPRMENLVFQCCHQKRIIFISLCVPFEQEQKKRLALYCLGTPYKGVIVLVFSWCGRPFWLENFHAPLILNSGGQCTSQSRHVHALIWDLSPKKYNKYNFCWESQREELWCLAPFVGWLGGREKNAPSFPRVGEKQRYTIVLWFELNQFSDCALILKTYATRNISCGQNKKVLGMSFPARMSRLGSPSAFFKGKS